MPLRRTLVAIFLLTTSTSCTVTKDPVTVNYTGLNYAVMLPEDKDSPPIIIQAPTTVASAPLDTPKQLPGCPPFTMPALAAIPIITQEELKATAGDDVARQKQLISHIEKLHKFTLAQQVNFRAAVKKYRESCGKK